MKRVDKNGTPVTATYSPEFTKVTPTGTNATSTGPQGVPQTGTPTFQGGDPLVPIDEMVEPTFADGSKEKNIPGQGTYTIAPDGTVTFTPDKQFVGKPDPVTVKRVDKNGTPVTVGYKRIESVKDPYGHPVGTKEVTPSEIGIDELYKVDSPYKASLKKSYEKYKKSKDYKDHRLTETEYVQVMHQTRSFE
ncbi:hypothetical protein V470_10825 [Streptococcus sp. VT 162]|nr:hypothetical protein V470_10825 [Streptococcus sp. VT 162]